MSYIANILVVTDPENSDNNGKVFKFSFGKKIFEKISAAMKGNPTLKKKGFDVFDYWKGADFTLVAKKKDGYVNYDDSSFDTPSVISFEDGEPLSDEKIEELIYNKQYKLTDEISPDKFKSYDALKTKLDRVLGVNETETTSTKPTIAKKAKVESFEEDDVPNFDEDSNLEADVDAIFKELEMEG